MERWVAVFIDAENMSASTADEILREAARHGALRTRRVYGDFTRPQLAAWLEIAPRHALTPCQTTGGGAAGKNGADIALVIDAVEALCGDAADVFCLATSDGDFTQLAMRIRQNGKTVVGFGKPKASLRLQAACDVFRAVGCKKVPSAAPAGKTPPRRRLEAEFLEKAFAAATPSADGWVGLPGLMKSLRAVAPSFEVKAYGYSQLSKLLADSGVDLTDKNRMARLKPAPLLKLVDNG